MRRRPLNFISFETFCIIGPVLFTVMVGVTSFSAALATDNYAGTISGQLSVATFISLCLLAFVLYISFFVTYLVNYFRRNKKAKSEAYQYKHPSKAVFLCVLSISVAIPVSYNALHSLILINKVSALRISEPQKNVCISEAIWPQPYLPGKTSSKEFDPINSFKRLFVEKHIEQRYMRFYQSCAALVEADMAK